MPGINLFGAMPRSLESELLDAEGVSPQAIAESYRELQGVNRWLGNTGLVLRLIRSEMRRRRVNRVLDIGCGQGALLIEIRDKLGVQVVGVDMRPAPLNSPVLILTGNAVSDSLPHAEVAVCLLMAHHLGPAEVAEMICNVSRTCRRFILLDLVRHPVPLALFQIFVGPFLCAINRADGQTSVRRAYTSREMKSIVEEALARSRRPVLRLRHTVAPFWIRQVVDITWAE
jgi:SAM-dependent methyltransferase